MSLVVYFLEHRVVNFIVLLYTKMEFVVLVTMRLSRSAQCCCCCHFEYRYVNQKVYFL